MLSSSHYLSAMDIQQWELIHPERLAGFQPRTQTLDHDCRLLLVANQPPQGAEILLLERILKAFSLSCRWFATSHRFSSVNLPILDSSGSGCGCDPLSHQAQKQLHSPRLSDIDGNTQYRRALWQQICAHQGIAS